MITVKIHNMFEEYLRDAEDKEEVKEDAMYGHADALNPYNIKEYDTSKFGDGRIMQFNTLKEVEAFRKDAENSIDFTEEHAKTFGQWDWQEIDIELRIDDSEDNTMILELSAHDEWRD